MTELVAVDIGGTHARFALAEVSANGIVLSDEAVLKTGEHAGLAEAWQAYQALIGRPLPRRSGIAVAAPVTGEIVRLTNNHWQFRGAELAAALGLNALSLVNDFAAVAYAITACGAGDLLHICGPDGPLPMTGVVSVVGPGTGLGVAILDRRDDGDRVIPTEGGHIEFAATSPLCESIRHRLKAEHGRVSLERVLSGPGLRHAYAALGGRAQVSDAELWASGLSRADPAAAQAVDYFCGLLGMAAGDFALAHGAHAVVIAGGVGLRLADRLASSGFRDKLTAKGRFSGHMASLPVKLITYPQPGLLGAAAAFAAEHMKRAPLQG